MTYKNKSEDEKQVKIQPTEKYGLFEPMVDYLYVDQLIFEEFVSANLKGLYNDDLICSEFECHFQDWCKDVQKKYGQIPQISLKLTDSSQEAVQDG